MTTSTSGVLGSYVYSYKPQPTLKFFEWDITEPTSPAGYRSVVSGIVTFVKQIGTGPDQYMQFEDSVIDFSSLQAEYAARVQAFTVVNSTNNFFVNNMRLWMPSGTALDNGGHIEAVSSGAWLPNATMPSGTHTAIPTSLPTEQNVFGQNRSPSIHDNADSGASEYVYMGLTVPSGLAFGRYGVGGTGNLTFRMTYDWYSTLNKSWLAQDGFPRYPKTWAYAYEMPDGASSGFFRNEDEIWLRAPTSQSNDLLLMFWACGNYNVSASTPPPEWTSILLDSSIPDIHSYYKRYDSAVDGSGMNYQWVIGFSNGNDLTAHIFRVVNGGTPIASGAESSSVSTVSYLSELAVTEKATVFYYFSTYSAGHFKALPSDMVLVASGVGETGGDLATPSWAFGYKGYSQAGVDVSGAFGSNVGVCRCQRIVVPYSA